MAAPKLLAPGIAIGVISAALMIAAIVTDSWYVINAELYLENCNEALLFAQSLNQPLPVKHISGISNGALDLQFSKPVKTNNEVILEGELLPRKSFGNPAPFLQSVKNNVNSVGQVGPLKTHRLRHNLQRNTGKLKLKSNAYLLKRNVSLLMRKNFSHFQKNLKKDQNALNTLESKLKNWKNLKESLTLNLHSFGGRDISSRRNRYSVVTIPMMSNKSKAVKQVSECRLRQFSTSTGLLRVCYDPPRGSLLDKQIRKGNITKCQTIQYSGVNQDFLPYNLRYEEKSVVFKDEKTSLDIRRAVVSFLFLGIMLHLSGLVMILVGWCRKAGFEQLSGGLVLVMSDIFQLSGLFAHIVLCRSELSRKPSDIYDLPPMVLHGLGNSAYIAWGSFVGNLIASFLCVMGPLHQPALPLLTHTETDNQTIKNDNAYPANSNKTSCQIEGKRQEQSISPKKEAVTVDARATKDQNFDDDKLSQMKSQKFVENIRSEVCGESKKFFNVKAEYSRSVMSPVAFVRTPKAAIKALEEEKRETLQLASKKWRSHSDAEVLLPAIPKTHHQQRNKTERLAVPFAAQVASKERRYRNGIPYSQSTLEKYMRKTRSLPRELAPSEPNLTRTRTSGAIQQAADSSPSYSSVCNHKSAYRSTLQPVDGSSNTLKQLDEVTQSKFAADDVRITGLRHSCIEGRDYEAVPSYGETKFHRRDLEAQVWTANNRKFRFNADNNIKTFEFC